jgi:lipoprotein-anchoring transpeptidase ErfK/SrfK
MFRRSSTWIAVGAVSLGFMAAGAWAWDAAEADQIAPGVSVGGVDIGDRAVSIAAQRLRHHVAMPYQRPVRVSFEDHTYTLSAKRLQLRADIDGMIAEAKQVSRQAPLPSRLWRYVTGGEVDKNLTPRVSFSRKAVDDFVEALRRRVDRPVREATVQATLTSLNPVPGQVGVQLRGRTLRDRIVASLRSSIASRTIRAGVNRIEPKTTTEGLPSQYPYYVTVDRGGFKLRLFKNLKLVKTYPIAVGMVGLETPAGLYHIQDKGENVAWHVPNSDWAGDLAGKTIPGGAPDNPIKARWMGIYGGAGIHGTDQTSSLGSAASHGCIRMAIPDVIHLYEQVSVGTPVYIG